MTISRKRRMAAVLTGSLLLVGGLAGCGQNDDTPATSGSDGSMMQRQSSSRSDLDGLSPAQGRQLRGELDSWCQELLGDRSWSRLDHRDRTEIMRTMHRRMRSLWNDETPGVVSPEWMPGPSMMTHGCRAVW